MRASAPTKVVGRRVGAFLVDSIIGWALYWGLIVALGEKLGEAADGTSALTTELFDDHARAQVGQTIYRLETGEYWLIASVTLAYFVAVLVLLQGLTGATLGKAVFGVRTVRPDGSPPGIGKAFVRWFLLIADAFPYIIPMLTGFIVALSSTGNRRVGDMVADTYVVRAAAAGQPVHLAPAPGPYAVYQPGMARAAPGPVTAGMPTGGADQPRWDPARNTYIRWDQGSQRWFQWQESERRWVPID